MKPNQDRSTTKTYIMKSTFYLVVLYACLLGGCTKQQSPPQNVALPGSVLLLKVDFLTNVFEGGTELPFTRDTSFTVKANYKPPGDFGWIKLTYEELNEPLFQGTIHWAGLGQMEYPALLNAAAQFTKVLTNDVVYPKSFNNVFNPYGQTYDYNPVWMAVQSLQKVRHYLATNPGGQAHLFLYTPSVGVGNPADWDWIVMLKK